MIINFRQGIISAKTDQLFINFSGNKININANGQSTDLAFAYGKADYLFSEVEDVIGAWGPFNSGINYWIYWDLDLKSGLRTFGSTRIQPQSGATTPTTGLSVDLHFFDLTEKKMKVWDGSRWNEKLRIFAGNVQGGTTLVPNMFGSQVGLSGNYSIGYILFDINSKPLIKTDTSGSTTFVTTEDKIHTQYDKKNSYKIDGLLIDGIAVESIPSYHCLSWKGPRQLGITSYVTYQYPCVGISVEPSGKNEVNQFVTKGFLTNFNNWNWSEPANTPLFVGATGEITTAVPQKYSIQKIGHIVAPDTIFVDIQEIILIEDTELAPTVSPTTTITPSISLSRTQQTTATPTPTPIVTTTLTATPSVTSPELTNQSPPASSPSNPATVQPNYITYLYSNNNDRQHVNLFSYDGTTITRLNDFQTVDAVAFENIAKWRPSDGRGIQGDPVNQQIAYGNGYGYRSLTVSGDGTLIDTFLNVNPSFSNQLHFHLDENNGTFSYVIYNNHPNLGIAYNSVGGVITNYDDVFTDVLNGTSLGDGISYNITNQGILVSSENKAILYATDDGSNDPIPTDKLVFVTATYNESTEVPQISIDKQVVDIGQKLINIDFQKGHQLLYEAKRYLNKEHILLGSGLNYIGYNYNTSTVDHVITQEQFSANLPDSIPTGGYFAYGSMLENILFAIYVTSTTFYLVAYIIDDEENNFSAWVGITLGDISTNFITLPRIRTTILSNNDFVIYTFTGFGIYKFVNGEFVSTGLNELEPDVFDYENIQDTWVGTFNLVPPSPSFTPTPTPSFVPLSPTPTPSVTRTPGLAPDYSAVVLGDNPTHYFPQITMDAVTTETATIDTGASLVTDSYGDYLSITASPGKLSLSSTFDTTNGGYTLEIWIKPTIFNSFHTLFGDGREGFYGLQFDNNRQLFLYGNNNSLFTGFTGTAGEIYHIVLAVDNSNMMSLYVNNTLISENLSVDDITHEFNIIGNDGDDEVFIGKIGDPAIYSFVLSPAQIAGHYNYGISNSRYGQGWDD